MSLLAQINSNFSVSLTVTLLTTGGRKTGKRERSEYYTNLKPKQKNKHTIQKDEEIE